MSTKGQVVVLTSNASQATNAGQFCFPMAIGGGTHTVQMYFPERSSALVTNGGHDRYFSISISEA